ncbi:hypothetical protein VUT01_09495 [Pseudomonas aeruginosa]|uniref:hypothetical protein n=1 Tax=Pseudomonas aeruginosa TaxID=287 RepID=UPI0030071A34
MTEQQACTLCGAGGHAAAQCNMEMDLIHHIAGLYSSKAIKGDITQFYITGNKIWMAQQILASQQAEGAQGETEMKQSQFRAELVKIMPGYNWTVHASHSSEKLLVATSIQSGDSNRLSTRPAMAHRIRGTWPPRLVPSSVSRRIVPEIPSPQPNGKGCGSVRL